jgi:hypothetical protein
MDVAVVVVLVGTEIGETEIELVEFFIDPQPI